ncbi:MAG: SMP-30/gluconolactonase/LRE family protein [Labilithrix sp.]|nr:SMP-30/gluconolactonase/LRE family protein [Labilithrix sp.]MCW5812166.1 SMP-30/gluconolactonase/LRE family protein [Labilithrix sp.]
MNRILPLLALTLFAVACGSSDKKTATNDQTPDGQQATNPDGTPIDPDGLGGGDPALAGTNPIEGIGEVQAIMEPGTFTDGPVWSENGGALYFSTPLGDGGLYRMLPDGRAIEVRTGVALEGSQPIGNTVHPGTGEIITAEAKRITKTTFEAVLNAPASVITANYDPSSQPGQTDPYAPPPPPPGDGSFDTLNDVVARKDGTLYVTDPGYFVEGGPAVNRIFRVLPNGGPALIVDAFEDIPKPNGIALSPDEKILYVGFTAPTQGTVPYIRRYALNEDGSLAGFEKFIDLGAESAPDGLAVDLAGNVYVATTGGVEVFKPNGERWGGIAVPETPTGMTFGGPEMKTLYITTQGTHIFQITTNLAGLSQ